MSGFKKFISKIKKCWAKPVLLLEDLLFDYSKPKFRKEVNYLKNFFSSEDGINILIKSYFRAETCMCDEPAGFLDLKSNKFDFLKVDDKKFSWFNGIINKDRTVLEEITAFIDSSIPNGKISKEQMIKLRFAKYFLAELNLYYAEKAQLYEILSHIKYFLTSFVFIPEYDCEKICMHVHPNKSYSLPDENNKLDRYEVAKGYSVADKLLSQDKSFGLIEYNHKIKADNLIVDFDVHHRFKDEEIRIGEYNFTACNQEIMVRGEKFTARGQTPKITCSRSEALFFLSESIYVLPFLSFDKNEPLNSKAHDDLDMIVKSEIEQRWKIKI